MPSSRSRHRHKSRGKSRHRSTHSSFRNQSAAAAPKLRNTSHPPPVHGRSVHEKTAQEVAEDHEYVKRVLAYLEKPGPAPPPHCGSKIKSEAQLPDPDKSRPPQCSKSKPPRAPKTERSLSANVTSRKKLQDKSQHKNCEAQTTERKPSSGAVPKITKTTQIDQLDLTVDSNIFDSDSDLSSTLLSMADQDGSGSNDSISSLCAMLASMGATQVTPDEINATRAAIKANLLNGYSYEDTSASKTASNVVSCNKVSIPVDQEVLKSDQQNSINKGEQLTSEELAAERKARKETKKAKKTIKGEATKEELEQNKTSSAKESNKENLPQGAAPTSDGSDKTKADLKRERRAIQEAQRAAKEKAMKSKTDALMQSKLSHVPTKIPPPSAVTKAPKQTPKTQNKSRVKGGSALPFVGLLRDPDYVVERPSYYDKVHHQFETLTKEIYLGLVTSNDSQCVLFLHALHAFLGSYTAEPGTDVERDVNERLAPNIKYLEHYQVYTPPMRNLMSLFREMLRQTHISFKETLAETSDVSTAAPYDGEDEAELDTSSSWSSAVRGLTKAMQDWTISFLHKTYEKNEKLMFPKVMAFLEDGDLVLVYGYSRLLLKSIQQACETGKLLLNVVVMAHSADCEEARLMASQLSGVNLNGGKVWRALLSDLANLVQEAQKVLLHVNHVFADGSTQGQAGHRLIVNAASKIHLPVLILGYCYQYTDIAHYHQLQDNRLCPPEDYLWGRRSMTRVARYVPRRGNSRSSVALKPDTHAGHYVERVTTNPSYRQLRRTITDSMIEGPCKQVDQEENIIYRTFQCDNGVLHDQNSYNTRGASLTVSLPGLEPNHALYPADVPACCLMYDVAPSTVSYALNDFCTMRPECAPTIMSRFHKLM
ncbi:uncharacterized protein LOC108680234 [Hyalella azteca]|uniref:Translation initiation factor eIF2B subunit delta n=1 Tax=Hyalella azteca TaxID=294128 RepID=A0A8B7PG05_HYAAZ|nr:uncharacterized protein LOC108680234 [Hyalella azteca]